ncbi:hypothetical protein MPER_08610 [Moniliophthora perniciosa FA553]|nr:hypothetical protein MPER_08610 [Moniliophthora perniciosa FA553]
MGATSVDAAAEGKGKAEAVLDSEQRKRKLVFEDSKRGTSLLTGETEYLADSGTHTHESKDVNTSARSKPHMMGESLQDKFEQGN